MEKHSVKTARSTGNNSTCIYLWKVWFGVYLLEILHQRRQQTWQERKKIKFQGDVCNSLPLDASNTIAKITFSRRFFLNTPPPAIAGINRQFPPHIHIIGWVSVAGFNWSGCANKQSNVLIAPQSHSVYTFPNNQTYQFRFLQLNRF